MATKRFLNKPISNPFGKGNKEKGASSSNLIPKPRRHIEDFNHVDETHFRAKPPVLIIISVSHQITN